MYNNPNDLITIEELCSILSIGRNTAYTLLKENKIKAFRIGRVWKITRLAVEEFVLSQSHLNFNSFVKFLKQFYKIMYNYTSLL